MDTVGIECERLRKGLPVAFVFSLETLHDDICWHTVCGNSIRSAACRLCGARPVLAAYDRRAAARERKDTARVPAVVVDQSLSLVLGVGRWGVCEEVCGLNLPLVAEVINDDHKLIAAGVDDGRLDCDGH